MSTGSTSGIKAGRAFVEIDALDKTAGVFKNVEARMKAVAGLASDMGKRLMALGGIALAPLAASVTTFAAFGDKMDKMAARTGVSVEALSELKFAAEQSGQGIEVVEQSIRRMQAAIGEAASGSKAAAEAFAAVGISLDSIMGLSPDKQMEAIADGLATIQDPTLRAAAAMEIFGRSGTALLPMFASGSAGIRQLREEAAALGLTMSREDATAAANLTDAMNRVKQAMLATWNAVGAALAPTLTDMANRLKEAIPQFQRWIRDHQSAIVTLAKVAAGAVALGGALYAIGAAASAASVTLAAVGASVAFIVANPIAVPVLAGAAALAALAAAYGTAGVKAAEFSDAAGAALAKNDAARQQAPALMRELQALADKQSMTADEMDRAMTIVARLEGAYGDLGLTVNTTANQILGMATAQEKLNEALRQSAIDDVRSKMAENQANQAKIAAELQSASAGALPTLWGLAGGAWFAGQGDAMTLGMSGSRAGVLDVEQQALVAEHTRLADRLRRLRDGDASAITGTAPTPEAAKLDTAVDKMTIEIGKAAEGTTDFTTTLGKISEKGDAWERAWTEMQEAQRQEIARAQAVVDQIAQGRATAMQNRPGYVNAVEAQSVEALTQFLANQANARGMDAAEQRAAEAARNLREIRDFMLSNDVLMISEANRK